MQKQIYPTRCLHDERATVGTAVVRRRADNASGSAPCLADITTERTDNLLVDRTLRRTLAPRHEPSAVAQYDDAARLVFSDRSECGLQILTVHRRMPVDIRICEWPGTHALH